MKNTRKNKGLFDETTKLPHTVNACEIGQNELSLLTFLRQLANDGNEEE